VKGIYYKGSQNAKFTQDISYSMLHFCRYYWMWGWRSNEHPKSLYYEKTTTTSAAASSSTICCEANYVLPYQ